jgi:hypothetical protein
MYRIKLILDSGRSVYPRDSGKILKFARMKAAEEAESMISQKMGYASDLSAFGPKYLLSAHPAGFDPVAEYVVEEHRRPLDTSSFYLGGDRVSDSD